MALYNDCEGNDVEIPTFEESEDCEYIKVGNVEDMLLLVKAMGFNNIADFDAKCELPASELVGKFFTITGTARGQFKKQPVFIMGEEETLYDKLRRGV